MDNLTHTLAGMLLADLGCAFGRRAEPERGWGGLRPAAFATSVLANNLPDLDAAYTWITRPRPLGSLLHHRGHTHTLILALPAGLLLALAVLRLLERRHGPASLAARGGVCALGVLGAALHILMDYGNNYGVHPFWPITGRWFYGDTIFIVEPLWLCVLLPGLAFAVRSRWLRGLLSGLLAIVLGLAIVLPFVSAASVGVLCVVAAVSGMLGWRAGPQLRSAGLLALCAAVALGFGAAAARARAAVLTAAAADFPELRVLDVVLSPLPGNPLCWNTLVVGSSGSDAYRVLGALTAPLPRWQSAVSCPRDAGASPTAALERLRAGERPELRWQSVYTTPLSRLRALARDDCRFAALLRFARVPYLTDARAPEAVAGDLRFDRSPGLDFSDLALAPPVVCPALVPPWTPPRAELIPPGD